jgi:hypothetical protein
MTTHASLLLTIMVVAGGAGGVASYFASEIPEQERWPVLRRVLLGVVAAFVVPLFLNMTSSDILAEGAASLNNYLVFAGFCVLAGFSSKAFLSSLSKKVLERVESVERQQEELKQEVAPIVEKQTEPAPEHESGLESLSPGAYSADEAAVLRALASDRYVRRHLGGVVQDSGLESRKAAELLESLRAKGLVQKGPGESGALFWLTAEGWRAVRS